MVLPTEITIKQETEDLEDDNKYTGANYEVQVKVESSQVGDDLDWCIDNHTECEVYDDEKESNGVVDNEKLLEYKPQRCFICGEMYFDSYTLYSHHLNHLQLKLVPITQHRYQCNDCLQYFKTKEMLTKHFSERDVPPSQDLLVRADRRPSNMAVSYRECKHCGKVMRYNNWHEHVNTVHATGNYNCDICGATFKCERYLKRHKQHVHQGVPRWDTRNLVPAAVKCTLCPAVLAHSYALRTHMRNCHCEKVRCEICQSVLKRSYLNNHVRRVHYSDGKEYKCECGKKFRSPRYLKIHKKNSHQKCR